MNQRLDEIRQRLAAATPGPWHASRAQWDDELLISTNQPEPRLGYAGWNGLAIACGCTDQPDEGLQVARCNAAFIAHAPTDIAYLLEQLATVQAQIPRWVSVEESLPEEQPDLSGTSVKVMVHSPDVPYSPTLAHYDHDTGVWEHSLSPMALRVTHWLAIPTLPHD